MPQITIGGTVINIPNQGSDPAWGEAWEQFAEVVAEQFDAISSSYDISPRVQDIGDQPTNLAINGTSGNFLPAFVRKFTFDYAIYRTNGSSTIWEGGTISGTYNGSQWIIQREWNGDKQTDGTSYHSFAMSGNELQLTAATAIVGSTTARISYSAKTELVSNS
jgi:hypothetical protein